MSRDEFDGHYDVHGPAIPRQDAWRPRRAVRFQMWVAAGGGRLLLGAGAVVLVGLGALFTWTAGRG